VSGERGSDLDLLAGELEALRARCARRVAWVRARDGDAAVQPFRGNVVGDAAVDAALRADADGAESAFLCNAAGDAGVRCPALDEVARRFALSPLERDALLAVAAPDLDDRFARAYAYLNDDFARPHATTALLLELLVDEPAERLAARAVFASSAPLRRFRLIASDDEQGPPRGALRCDERVLDLLRGVERVDERLVQLLRPVGAGLITDEPSAAMDAIVEAFGAAGTWPRIALLADATSAPLDVALAASAALGMRLLALDARRFATAPNVANLGALLGREAVLLGALFYADLREVSEPGELEAVVQAFALIDAPLLAACETPRLARERFAIVAVPPSTSGARRALWGRALGPAGAALNGHLDRLAAQFVFDAPTIAEVASACASPDGSAVDPAQLRRAARARAHVDLDAFIVRIEPRYGWDDIVVPAAVAEQLREIAVHVHEHATVFERWAFGRKHRRGQGVSALFHGESGTGKTMAAEVIANELDLELYRVDLAGVVSKYIGETEKNLRRVFDLAERSGAILFFDEADALFGKRTEVRDSHDRYANIEVNYLLQRMEDHSGCAILATNRKAELDTAFTRRLRFVVEFPFPDAELRRRIWNTVFPTESAPQELDKSALAKLEIAGGSIRQIAVGAAFLAAGDAQPIAMTHVVRAALREYRKLDRTPSAAEFGHYLGAAR
jgi:hypothetical protein